MQTQSKTQTGRKKKSEALTRDEISALKAFLKTFHTIIDCAEAIGIHRVVLDRVLVVGSAAPETIAKIRLAIGTETIKEG